MKPKYNEGSKCPECKSTDTVGLIINLHDDSHYTELGWCSCGAKWYKYFDGAGDIVEILHKQSK